MSEAQRMQNEMNELGEIYRLKGELLDLRDERDRLARALEQVNSHLAQPGDDETPANQYVPTAAETLTCQRIIEAALTPAGGGQREQHHPAFDEYGEHRQPTGLGDL